MGHANFLSGGGEMGALTRSYNWAGTSIGTPEQWPQSLLTTVSILLNSKFPMFLWWGEDHIQFYNDAYRPSMGLDGKHPLALGQKGKECWPEIWPTIYPLIRQVLDGGEATWQENALIPIYRNNELQDVYWTFSYSPVKGETGKVEGVLVVCTETTATVQNLQKISISEQRFSNLVRESTIGIVVLEGEGMVVSLVNKAYSKLIGRRPEELLGKELFSIIPEVEDPFRALLNNVRLTGEPVYLYDQPYRVYANGTTIEGFLNVAYEPYREVDGTITGVMALCQDITSQVLNVQKLRETEVTANNTAQRLELALAAGRLGSYEYIFETGEVDCNLQCRLHIGLPLTGTVYYEQILAAIVPEDREVKHQVLTDAIGQDVSYNTEYRVRWSDGSIRWIRVAGNLVYNEKGRSVKLVGITIDITEQKLFTEELAKQVHERTLELQRSNEDLLQFAHVTSHDLKEPVRKIMIWSSRLQQECSNALSDKATFYLSKVQHATNRIQLMIDSILTFSSASASNQEIAKIDLNDVVAQVETDLEILIQEKQAVISRQQLPAIEGAGILLYQLFYNLINNALKFARKDQATVISITSTIVDYRDMPAACIILTDNGIGFNKKFSTKIFSAFTRLNSKDEYEGTGLGLALCQKVVERHGGLISATGEEGKGATFTILLPLSQSNKTVPNLLSRIEEEKDL
jgi:PAS domain S-box-containing protein